MSGMKSWSTTAASNVLANTGFSMDEGMAPSVINDSVRQLMADVRTEWAQGASIASAATVDLSTSTGGYVTITGSTGPITSLGTVSAGIRRKLLFTGTPTITHNATSLISPTGASIVVVAGDTCEVMSEGSGNWRIVSYAGQTVQAASLGAKAVWGTGVANFGTITKRKTADETVSNSAVLQDDDHLLFPIAANEEWIVDFYLGCTIQTTTGLRVAVTSPTSSTIDVSAQVAGNTNNGGHTTASGTAIDFGTAGGATPSSCIVNAWISNSSVAGNVTLQWAQSSSGAATLTVHKGAHLKATRVA